MLKSTNLSLAVPGNTVILGASGGRAVRSLSALARMMQLECSVLCEAPDAMLTDVVPPDGVAFGLEHRHNPPFYLRSDGAFAVVAEAGWPFHLACDWPLLLAFGVLRKLLRNKFITAMHGALLETAPGSGVIVFGPGGIGKTTTVGRFRAAGGTARSDDMLLLSWNDGILTANPLPTRSWYTEHWSKHLRYPYSPGVEVKRLLLLERGITREEVVETGRDQWLGMLIKAMTMFLVPHVRFLPVEKKRYYGEAILNFAETIASVFPALELRAKLDEDLMNTLNGAGTC